jgi:hypothetical protein
MNDLYSLNCSKCPICVHIDIYDPTFSAQSWRYMGDDERLGKKLETMLKPCGCGGHFGIRAPYRCPRCLAPFSREEVTKHIDTRVGSLVMSKAVMGVDYWKEPKSEHTGVDTLVQFARIGQFFVGQWVQIFVQIFKGLLKRS